MTLPQPTLTTARLRLLPADPQWAAAMLAHHRRNLEHFAPWNPTAGPQFFTEEFWTLRLRQSVQAWLDGQGARFLLQWREQPGEVIGTVSLSNVVRGVFQACHLGYGIDHAHEGQGLMREALQAVIAFAFDDMKLHRLQANYQPANVRSGALLERLGFTVEGEARDYLFLHGAWRDHVLTSLTNPRFDPASMLA